MDKTFIRIQGIRGGSTPVLNMMSTMRENGIPFVLANNYYHYGSRRLILNWSSGGELLYALVRISDIPMIKLLNTQCRIVENPEFEWWRIRSTKQLAFA
jgi:hypothetical protein